MRAPSLGRAVALSLAVALLAGCSGDDAGTGSDTTASTTSGTVADDPVISADSKASSSTTTPTGTVVEITIAGGQVTEGGGRIAIPLGDPVVLRVTADEPEELHLHGYDLYFDVGGDVIEHFFEATIPGVFELEGHDSGVVVAELEIS